MKEELQTEREQKEELRRKSVAEIFKERKDAMGELQVQ